jgi:integrase
LTAPAASSAWRSRSPANRREVPLSANADAVLARRWTEGATGYVFGTKNWYAFQTAWLAALRRAKIEDFRFHDLRHTCASWLVQRGRTLREVQEALGHRTLAMTVRYSHLAPEHLRAEVAVLDDVLSAGAQGGHKLPRVTEAPQTIPA